MPSGATSRARSSGRCPDGWPSPRWRSPRSRPSSSPCGRSASSTRSPGPPPWRRPGARRRHASRGSSRGPAASPSRARPRRARRCSCSPGAASFRACRPPAADSASKGSGRLDLTGSGRCRCPPRPSMRLPSRRPCSKPPPFRATPPPCRSRRPPSLPRRWLRRRSPPGPPLRPHPRDRVRRTSRTVRPTAGRCSSPSTPARRPAARPRSWTRSRGGESGRRSSSPGTSCEGIRRSSAASLRKGTRSAITPIPILT